MFGYSPFRPKMYLNKDSGARQKQKEKAKTRIVTPAPEPGSGFGHLNFVIRICSGFRA
jgi:hypothetical protein